MPALVAFVTYAHVSISRRHGPTPVRKAPAVPRWPDQSVRDAMAIAGMFAVLLAYVVGDPRRWTSRRPPIRRSAFDARPLWPFRWLFELRVLAGRAEKLAAMAAPALVGGFLIGLPLLDRRPERAAKDRRLWLGALAGLFALIGALTVASFARDCERRPARAPPAQGRGARRSRAPARADQRRPGHRARSTCSRPRRCGGRARCSRSAARGATAPTARIARAR